MNDKRITYRRYEDRRVSMMLAIHEILFEHTSSSERDLLILRAVVNNYQVDRAALLDIQDNETAKLGVRVGDWPTLAPIHVNGNGFEQLLSIHRDAVGALTFESVRKPEMFSTATWEDLWKNGVAASARALLSVAISPNRQLRRLLWLQQSQSSREWSSRDRDLAEEIAALLTRAIEKRV